MLRTSTLVINVKRPNFSNRVIGIINFEKTFSKFYRSHYELISKYNVGLKTLLGECLSEPEFYGDLVIGRNDFSFQFRTRYTFNPIMVDNYAAFFMT